MVTVKSSVNNSPSALHKPSSARAYSAPRDLSRSESARSSSRNRPRSSKSLSKGAEKVFLEPLPESLKHLATSRSERAGYVLASARGGRFPPIFGDSDIKSLSLFVIQERICSLRSENASLRAENNALSESLRAVLGDPTSFSSLSEQLKEKSMLVDRLQSSNVSLCAESASRKSKIISLVSEVKALQLERDRRSALSINLQRELREYKDRPLGKTLMEKIAQQRASLLGAVAALRNETAAELRKWEIWDGKVTGLEVQLKAVEMKCAEILAQREGALKFMQAAADRISRLEGVALVAQEKSKDSEISSNQVGQETTNNQTTKSSQAKYVRPLNSAAKHDNAPEKDDNKSHAARDDKSIEDSDSFEHGNFNSSPVIPPLPISATVSNDEGLSVDGLSLEPKQDEVPSSRSGSSSSFFDPAETALEENRRLRVEVAQLRQAVGNYFINFAAALPPRVLSSDENVIESISQKPYPIQPGNFKAANRADRTHSQLTDDECN